MKAQGLNSISTRSAEPFNVRAAMRRTTCGRGGHGASDSGVASPKRSCDLEMTSAGYSMVNRLHTGRYVGCINYLDPLHDLRRIGKIAHGDHGHVLGPVPRPVKVTKLESRSHQSLQSRGVGVSGHVLTA